MAKCKTCDAKGMFMKLHHKALCTACNARYEAAKAEQPDVFSETMATVEDTSADLSARISAATRALSAAQTLAPFEAVNLPTGLDRSAKDSIAKLEPFPDTALRDYVSAKLQRATAQSDVAKTAEARMAPYQDLLQDVMGLQPVMPHQGEWQRQVQRVREALDNVDLNAAITAAEKEEFKGNTDQAIELYLEALFLARKDAIDDEAQLDTIRKLQAKVTGLGGTLPPSEERDRGF